MISTNRSDERLGLFVGFGNASKRRLPSLDGWRAVAVTLVVLSHFQYAADCPRWFANGLQRFFDGDLGVRVFFGISGFLITFLLLEEYRANGTISLTSFYARRCLRIFPVYYIYLGYLGLLSAIGVYHDDRSSWLGALTFTRNIIGRGDSATVHFWSLAIEEQFYLCRPLTFKLLKLGRQRSRTLLILCAVIVSALVCRGSASFFADDLNLSRLWGARSIFRYADCLAIGCLSAYVLHGGYFFVSIWLRGMAWAALACGLFVDQFFLPHFHSVAWLIPTLQGFAFCWLMVESVAHPVGYGILNRSSVAAVGMMSYSLYVWQMVFLKHFAPHAAPYWLQSWVIWWCPAILFASLSYRFVEKPVNKLRSKLHRRRIREA